jgi:hypothetical protein
MRTWRSRLMTLTAARHRQIGFNPCERAAFDDDRLAKPSSRQISPPPSSRAGRCGTADKPAGLSEVASEPGFKFIQRNIARLRNMDFREFHRRAHVNHGRSGWAARSFAIQRAKSFSCFPV